MAMMEHALAVAAPDTSKLVGAPLIGDLPDEAAKRWGDRLALSLRERRWSFIAFAAEVDRLTAALLASGIRKGDRVAVWLNNCPEYEFLIFAIIKAGAIIVPLNTRYRVSDLAYALEQSGSRMLIAAARSGPVDYDALLAQALASTAAGNEPQGRGLPALEHIVMMGGSRVPGAVDWDAFAARGAGGLEAGTLPRVAPGDAALMLYTSGTTGHPKGVLLDHGGMALHLDRARIIGLGPDDVQLTYLPLFHTYALSYTMVMSLMAGCPQVLMEAFDADLALDLIEQHGVTVIHGFDAHFSDFLQAQARRKRDISSLRFGTMTVGADSSIALARRVQAEMCPTLSGYGMTEMWGGITISPHGSTIAQRCEASGVPQKGVELRVVDPETQRPLAPGSVGEIHVRSFSRMIGYHAQPEATAAVIDAQGWFHSGDAGILGTDGHIRWIGRYKDMLKVGGENVSPAEIEALLASIPGVAAVAVVAQRHERLQETPVAFVVKGDGGPATEQAVIDWCRGKVAGFKIPSRVIFIDQLPMTATGKVQKELLRQRLSGDLAVKS